MKIKAGDTIVVLSGGSDADKFVVDKKGQKTRKTAKVLRVFPKTDRLIAGGINIVKKHERPTKENEPGKIVEKEAPIHISNVSLIDPKTGFPTKVGYKEVNGKKVRYAKRSGEILDSTKSKAK